MRETVYYQRGMPDPIYDEKFILDIVHKHIPTAKKLESIDEDGGEARVYIVDDSIFLKIQRPQQLRSTTSLEKEAFFLNQLEKQTDAYVPRVLGYGKEGTLEYICMTRIPGVKVEYTKLSVTEKNALLLELGKELRKIHSIDQTTLRNSGLFPCDDPHDLTEQLQRRYKSALMKKKDSINLKKFETIMEAIDKDLQNIKYVDTFVGLHVNPYICHTLVDEKTHKYTGLIDFGDSYIGHPIFDMWYWQISSRKKILQGYTSEKPISAAFQFIFGTLNSISQRVYELN
jgi:aminoglycoside phosphotransferase (APT) family kinase protein